MKRTSSYQGFFLTLFLNLALQFEWIIIALLALAAHFVFSLSLLFFYILLGGWLLYGITITLILGWASHCSSKRPPENRNKNPYSSKNEDFLKK